MTTSTHSIGTAPHQIANTAPGELMAQVLTQLHDTVEQSVDPLGVSAPITHAQIAWLTHPQELNARMLDLS